MDLKDFLKTIPAADRQGFADQVASNSGHLRNISYGYRPCSPALAVAIEKASAGQVRRWDLRPDDWHLIWPELVGRKGAPGILQAS